MKTISKRLLLAMAGWLLLSPAWAQHDSLKVITRSTMVGIGGTNVLDTYLSSEHFSGTGFTLLSTVERQRPGSRWSTLLQHEADLSSVNDRTDTQRMMEGAYHFYGGRLYGWHLLDGRLHVQAGAVANVTVGFIYNAANSNNPAQARAQLAVMPTGAASYRFTLFRKTFLARYELNLPLVGIRFSPNYGQSYYEIFSRGNYDHNVVLTTPFSAPEWRQQLTLDAGLTSSLVLRVGYLGNIQQAKVNGLRQHVWSHRFLLGITKRFSIVNVKM